MKKLKLAILVSSLTCMTATFAAMPLPMGWYAEGNVGTASEDGANYGTGLSSTTVNGISWNINGGYKFMPYLAAELGYTSYKNEKITFNSTQVARDEHYSYYLAGKAILPISDSGMELFAKLGIGNIHNHVTVTNASVVNANGLVVNTGTNNVTGAYIGLGADYSFTPNVALSLQWNRAKGNNSTGNLDLYSLGLSYLFG